MRAGLLVLAAALALAGETGAAAPPDEGAARRIVGTGSCAMPAWAPDGGRLLFHARRKDDKQKGFAMRNVWSIGADGAGEKKLTGGTKDEYHASLSPDGKKLLFVSELNGSRDIWLADADGQNPVPLTDDPGTEDQPAWSPDGRQIAYAAFPREGGSFDLWTVNADGSGRRRLTTTPANELFPAWHPDGVHLVYVTDASGNFDLYQIDVRDGRTTPLVVSPDHEARPAFSSDGTKLAFSRWPAHGRSADATLWVANADGTAPIELTTAPAPATHPAWSPDGRTLAFQHRVATGWEIWTLALPADIARTGHLRLAQQVRGGADVDTAKLRSADTVRGTVEEATFRVRAAYGALVLPRAAVASILFGSGERGLARVVLANGDTVTGFLENEGIAIAAGGRTQRLAVEQLEQLSLRAGRAPAGDIRLGQQLQKEVESEVTLLRLSALTQLVNSIGQRLQESAPDPAFKLFPYSFRVVDSPEVNAFALPGGPIYINSALIELCDTEDQLASVIGHEMGHVAARHATEMLTTQNLTQLALIAAVSVIPVPVPPIAWEGTKLGYVLGLLSYSRGKEAEADHLGLVLMNAAGYDASEMAIVFRRLAEQQHSLPSVVERFFSSHPLSEDRMRDAERRAAALPRPANAPVATARPSTFSEVNLMFAKD